MPPDEELARAVAWEEDRDLALLTAARLQELARAESLEFATALLYDRLCRAPANAAFLQAASNATSNAEVACELIGVVPGAFHREHRNTGADGARVLAIARAVGCEAELIPTASFGTLEENARLILDWLAAHRGRRLGLISLSKGGAEVKRALAAPEAGTAFAEVAAWVSFSGMVQGTPLVDWLQRRPMRWWGVRALLWWRGHSLQALRDLRHRPLERESDWPAIPPRLRIVHVFGFPLRRHLAHPWATRGYERLAPLGPNDGGGILLADLARLPGIVCPLWGADHYLTPSWDMTPILHGIVHAALAKG